MEEVEAILVANPYLRQNATFMKELYNTLNDTSCLDDFMTIRCSHFFSRCSLDGPVPIPCREFCEDTKVNVDNYFQALDSIGLLGMLGLDNFHLSCFSYLFAENRTTRFCEMGKPFNISLLDHIDNQTLLVTPHSVKHSNHWQIFSNVIRLEW